MEENKKKQTRESQLKVLKEIRDLLIPIANLSRYHIGEINKELAEKQRKKTTQENLFKE